MGRWLCSLVVVASLVPLFACTEKPAAGPDEDGHAEAPVPVPVVRDESTNLLFSYVDVRGRIQAASRVAEVPDDVKERVLVVDLQKTPDQRAAHRYAFFADLTAKKPDGTYDVVVVSRYNAARGEAPQLLPNVPAGTVVLYSAVWCGFCKKAKAWLSQNNVPFVERDVERTAGASAELSKKLADAGLQGGGVPVIDWGGTLVMGFDVGKLEKLLAAQGQNAP